MGCHTTRLSKQSREITPTLFVSPLLSRSLPRRSKHSLSPSVRQRPAIFLVLTAITSLGSWSATVFAKHRSQHFLSGETTKLAPFDGEPALGMIARSP